MNSLSNVHNAQSKAVQGKDAHSMQSMQDAHSVQSKDANGILITFEGDDGVGKSTHIAFLADVLRAHGLEVLCLREPGGTSIGENLRAIVLDAANSEMSPQAELLIYEAARAQIVAETIKPALAQGVVVLCDRFTDSTMAYQGYGRGLDMQFIDAANIFATGGIEPACTLFFTIPDNSRVERMKKRAAEDRLEAAGSDFHNKVAQGFAEITKSNYPRVKMVNAGGCHSQTAREVFAQLSDIFPWIAEETPKIAEMLAAFDAAHSHSKNGEDQVFSPDKVDKVSPSVKTAEVSSPDNNTKEDAHV